MKLMVHVDRTDEPWLTNALAKASAVEVKESRLSAVLNHGSLRPGTRIFRYKTFYGYKSVPANCFVQHGGLPDPWLLHHLDGTPWYASDLIPGYLGQPADQYPLVNPGNFDLLNAALGEILRLKAMGYTDVRVDEAAVPFLPGVDGDMQEFPTLGDYYTAWTSLLRILRYPTPMDPARGPWLMYPSFYQMWTEPHKSVALACGSLSFESWPAGVGLFPKNGSPHEGWIKYGDDGGNNDFYVTTYDSIERNLTAQDELIGPEWNGVPMVSWGHNAHASIRAAEILGALGREIYFCLADYHALDGTLPSWLGNEIE